MIGAVRDVAQERASRDGGAVVDKQQVRSALRTGSVGGAAAALAYVIGTVLGNLA